jgi:zinc protease
MVFPYPIATKTLDNGLTIEVVTMPSDAVAVYTWMRVGSRDEIDAGRTGFAHFFEHLSFYGTPTLGSDARQHEVLALGADENAWTWFDETVYHAVLSKDELPRWLAIEADRFEHLHLTDADIRRESGAVYGEFRKGQSNPDQRLSETLYGTAFTTHTYRHDTMGFEADIQAMPTAFAYSEAFFDRFYRPENATVIVVGNVDPETVFALVAKDWAGWERGKEPRPVIPVEPPQTATRQAHVDWPSATATRVAMGWHIPGYTPEDPDSAALQLAGEVLLSPVGSLHRRLIEDGALAFDVSGGADRLVDPGLFTVTVTLQHPEDLDKVEQIVREEVAALQHVDPAALDATRSHAKYAFLTSLDDPDNVASALGWELRRGRDANALDAYYTNYDAQTPATVAAVSAKWLVDTGLTVVTLSPASK